MTLARSEMEFDNNKAEPSEAQIVSEIEDTNKAEPREAPMKRNAHSNGMDQLLDDYVMDMDLDAL